MKARRRRRPSRRRTGPPNGGGGSFAGGGGRGHGDGGGSGSSTPEFSRWQGGVILAVVPLMLIMLWLLTKGVPPTSERALSSDPMFGPQSLWAVTGVAANCGRGPEGAEVTVTARAGSTVAASVQTKYGQGFLLQVPSGHYAIYAGTVGLFKVAVASDGTVSVIMQNHCS